MVSVIKVLIYILLLQVTACASLATSGFDKSNTIGRDVDEVVVELSKNGIGCGAKYSEKSVNSSHISGSINCGIKEKSLVCPKSYGIYLSYDLDTNKVTSIFKDERDNCF